MASDERLDRIERTLEHLVSLLTEVAHDSFRTSAQVTQLREVYDTKIANDLADLRRMLGATGDAPDRHRVVHDARLHARERAQ